MANEVSSGGFFTRWIPGFKQRDPSQPRDAAFKRHWPGIVLFSICFAFFRVIARRVCKRLKEADELEAWAVAEVARKHKCAADGTTFVPSLSPMEAKREAKKKSS